MDFNEKVEQWKQLVKVDREGAEKFYYEELFPEVVLRFQSKSKHLKKYRYLISLLGFSPAPLILLIKTIEPEKVLFIHSDETEKYLNLIQQQTGLLLSQVEKAKVNSSEATEVYKAIKPFIAKKNPSEILVDITGGKKAMVGGAAMAGNVLNMDICYVDYEGYLSDLRQPVPGTEYPNLLKNPLQVLGDIDFQRAKDFFNQCHFGRCLEVLKDLDQRVEDLWGVRRLMKLADLYQRVDTFHFTEALEKIEELLRERCEGDRFVRNAELERLRRVLLVLRDKDDVEHQTYSCLNYFFAGMRFAERKRYDVAVFLMYRTIEMVLSGALKEAGIDPSNPVYPPSVTIDLYNEKLKEIYDKPFYADKLPRKVGLMDSAILLSIKGDPVVKELKLKALQGIVNIRNDSHFTHGSRALGEDDFNKIRRTARKLLEKYLGLKDKPRVEEWETLFAFPKL